eukprot:UN24019
MLKLAGVKNCFEIEHRNYLQENYLYAGMVDGLSVLLRTTNYSGVKRSEIMVFSDEPIGSISTGEFDIKPLRPIAEKSGINFRDIVFQRNYINCMKKLRTSVVFGLACVQEIDNMSDLLLPKKKLEATRSRSSPMISFRRTPERDEDQLQYTRAMSDTRFSHVENHSHSPFDDYDTDVDDTEISSMINEPAQETDVEEVREKPINVQDDDDLYDLYNDPKKKIDMN